MSRFRYKLNMLIRTTGVALCALVLLLSACGGGSSSADSTAVSTASASAAGAMTSGAELTEWTEFGLNPQRSDATNRPTGITAANLAHLHGRQVLLPGTVDSSPIYLHGAEIAGKSRNVVVVTTTYGKTLAIDADSAARLWTFTPASYSKLLGSDQISTASPLADPDGRFVYSTSPDGVIHKLSLSSGQEVRRGGWPVTVTRDPTHEKLGSALNLDGPDLLVTTSGYIGDAPTYQGHVVAISRETGKVSAVFNSLCANRHRIIVPTSCPASDSAVLSRGGAVVEPGGRRLLFDTGNGPWNGSTNFGDSGLELSFPGLRLRQAFTPKNQAELNENDLDLGSSAPALLGSGRVLLAGKDGIMRVLDLARLDGSAPGGRERLGGETQTLPTPGGTELFTQPAVWHHGKGTTVFVADSEGTAAYAVRRGRLRRLWENGTPGTSPILAGGLLYVYEPNDGGIEVYSPSSVNPIAELPGSSGHWNSPIVVDGHVVEPEGDANDHARTGTLELFTLGECRGLPRPR
jgi:hypothetical protein